MVSRIIQRHTPFMTDHLAAVASVRGPLTNKVRSRVLAKGDNSNAHNPISLCGKGPMPPFGTALSRRPCGPSRSNKGLGKETPPRLLFPHPLDRFVLMASIKSRIELGAKRRVIIPAGMDRNPLRGPVPRPESSLHRSEFYTSQSTGAIL